MSFIQTVRRAGEVLRQQGRISLRALKLEFNLDDEQLEALVEELVDIQQIAAREGKALAWIGSATDAPEPTTVTNTQAAIPDREPLAEAERRQLTVLFCDLVDSTELATRMDAEDWREVVRRFQQVAVAAFERFGGHVAQYLGDGVLVYFGYPQAHEDDAERAVRAGLGVMAALGELNAELEQHHSLRLGARIGIHTGPVVVGEMGSGTRRETLAMGDTANVAARLQGIAEPGTVALSSATLRLVSGIFVTCDLGEQSLKGLAEPVRAFEAIQASGVRSRLDVMAASELTPFIGREQELMLLEDRFAQVAEGSGQAVLISGEAGIGKSRLMQAFRERITERAHSWLECRGSPYTQDSALLPVIELQRRGLGFRAEDPPEAKLVAIETGLAGVGFDLAPSVPLVAGLHGVALGDGYTPLDLSPEGTRKKTLALLVEWLLRLGQRQPLVLLMEDLHWMDPSTLELLGQILEQIPTVPVLLLATYRPDFEPPWGARSHVTPMLLSRFTRPQLADLVHKAARGRDLPDAWIDEILRRADGVPLFAEELTRTVLENHPEQPAGAALPALEIPDTLQDSLMARLDALGPVKELAQLASVLGREFDYALLLAVSPMKEAELESVVAAAVREELFYQRGTPPEASYLFKHALIRDAAYESLLRTTRQRHHRRVAETLIERMPQLAEDQPELVANHWTAAGEPELAVEWWERAGHAAKARMAHEEAIRHLRAGLAEVARLRESAARNTRELDLLLPLGTSLVAARGYAHPGVGQAFEDAQALCDETTEPRHAGLVKRNLASYFGNIGAFEQNMQLVRETVAIGRKHGDEELVIEALGDTAAQFCLPRLAEGLEFAQEACDLYDPERHRFDGDFVPGAGIIGWGWLALLRWSAGYPDRAWAAARRAQAIAASHGGIYDQIYADCFAGLTARLRRDWTEARRLGESAGFRAAEQGFPLLESLATFAESGGAVHQDGDISALDRFSEAMARAGSTGMQVALPWILGGFADMQIALGRAAEAVQTIAGALAQAAATGQRFYDSELHRLRAECSLGRPDRNTEEAESELRQAIEIARSQAERSFELRAAISLARLWRDQGKRTEARDLLQPVYAWFTEGFDTQDLTDAKALLEELA